jgi:cephalosporin hydroxylase
VFDTIIEKLGEERLFGRPWGKGNNPMTAVKAFLEGNSDFEVDASVDCRLVISAGSGGYLRRKS